MKTREWFQFNASPGIPAGWQRTLLEVLELCNARFRPYYRQTAQTVLKEARRTGCQHVVELAAGTAPLTRRLLQQPAAEHLRFTLCDRIPQNHIYQPLAEQFPGRVRARTEPFDLAQPHQWEPGTLVVLSAAFHHIPAAKRPEVFQTLAASADRLVLVAPVRKTLWCLLHAPAVALPAILLPACSVERPGRWRRLLWCNLLPVIPLILIWDSIGGCLRQWERSDWEEALQGRSLPRPLEIYETAWSQTVLG